MSANKAAAREVPTRAFRAAEVLQFLEAMEQEMVDMLCQLVQVESPSGNWRALSEMADMLTAEFVKLGGSTKLHRQEQAGDHLQIDFAGKEGKPVLLLGHYDTVWEVGTLASMLCRVERGRVWGPGAFDMKGGIVQIMFALRALRQIHFNLPRPVTVLLVSDEEVGSETSRAITEDLAKKSAAVLVCEPAQSMEGALKTARKGVGDFTVRVLGKASHAGVDFLAGQSAVHELARQIVKIEGFTELKRGITVNVGVIRGGTRTNVVAAEASAEVDVRIAKLSDTPRIERKLRSLKPFNRKCKLEVTGGINRPPLERTPMVVELFRTAEKIAGSLGWRLKEASTGGGSDGNFTAALGVPTLDGLGAVGDGAHATHESVVISELPRRAALLAGLIEAV
ncbi:MAG: M20 family metallopeptidase [Acidobacteriales bacterium]|nr:M20 family metallopeptidase [Terriglobales bacterium]